MEATLPINVDCDCFSPLLCSEEMGTSLCKAAAYVVYVVYVVSPRALLQHCPAAQHAELRSEQSTALLGVQKWQSSVWDNKCCSSIHVPVLFSVCNSSNQGLMYSRALSFSVHVLGNHRIIKVEKTLKISQSNRPPTTNVAH